MRTDEKLGLERVEDLPGLGVPGRFFEDGVSQSGNERHHLFSQLGGSAFRDVSGVSGLDGPADGRAFAWLDFDRDGWLDVASVNANAPLLELFRNEMGALTPGRDRGALIIELEGGARPGDTGGDLSNRSAIGARVHVVHHDGRTQLRELRAGEGLAAQNAARLHFGLGEAEGVARVDVTWPSGRTSSVSDVPAGTLLRVAEGGEVSRESWTRAVPPLPATPEDDRRAVLSFATVESSETPAGGAAVLNVFTSFATWCGVCLGELPQVALLREAFAPDRVSLHGVPIDPEDTAAKLESWSRKHRPAYRVRSDWPAERRAQLADWLEAALRSEGLPATVVLDANGVVLHTQWGVPTVSTLHALGTRARGAETAASDTAPSGTATAPTS